MEPRRIKQTNKKRREKDQERLVTAYSFSGVNVTLGFRFGEEKNQKVKGTPKTEKGKQKGKARRVWAEKDAP